MENNSYAVKPVSEPLSIKAKVPGSKSITNRALLLASLAEGKSTLQNVLFSEDSKHFLDCLTQLGYQTEKNEADRTVMLYGGRPSPAAEIYVGSAGTAARFITAMLAACRGEYEIHASAQMQARPMRPLFEALRGLGAEITYLKDAFHLPVKLQGNSLKGGEIALDVSKSSQFLSALLMTGCLHREDLRILPQGKQTAKAYIDITLNMIRQFGGAASRLADGSYHVAAGSSYRAMEYWIEPDISAACYFYAMAFLTGGKALVEGVHADSMQGDMQFLHLLEQMGAKLEEKPEGIELTGPADGAYPGVEVDMNDFSDQTMTLAALAVYAQTPTRIRGIGHIRYQESDRIAAAAAELARMGIKALEEADGIIIFPGRPEPALVETYDDHRIAMAFSLIGLKAEGIQIQNPSCTAKTFKEYFGLFHKIIHHK